MTVRVYIAVPCLSHAPGFTPAWHQLLRLLLGARYVRGREVTARSPGEQP